MNLSEFQAEEGLSIDTIRDLLEYESATGRITWRIPRPKIRVGQSLGGYTAKGYLRGKVAGHHVMLHRLAFAHFHGRWPSVQIDHINGKRDDNRIENLREATRTENARHAKPRKDGSSGVRGVVWHQVNRKWKVTIGTRYVGLHATLIDAVAHRLRIERTEHGAFASWCLRG